VLVFDQKLMDSSYAEMHRHLRAVLVDQGLDRAQVVLSNYGEALVLILSDSSEADLAKQVVTGLLECAGYLFERDRVQVGIGSYQKRVDLVRSYRDAKRVMHWVTKSRPRLGAIEDLGLVRFLDMEDEGLLEYLNNRYIEPLRTYDRENSSELLYTMKVYVDNRWGFADAAKQLFIHANSVKYRIKQVKEIMGDDLMRAETRTELELALVLDDFLHREME
jgi:sugar diacid utilization regulator